MKACNLYKLGADTRGVAFVEMAMCAPFLAVLLGGMIDLGSGLAERHNVQRALNVGLEIAQAHPPKFIAGETDFDYTYIRQETAAAAKTRIEDVAIDRWLECDGTRQPIDATCLPAQTSARFLQISVVKRYQPRLVPKTYDLRAAGAVRIQ